MPDEAARRGKLFLVGFGPGDHDHLTFRAKAAIDQAEIVIGYRTYILLVKDLIQGKRVIYTGMTEEIARAKRAIDLAYEGHPVALISSGDVGIYGMAGPVFELLRERGWVPGQEIDVEVIPGVTAASSCASVLGAPLVHDFCTISLSDLLTPWEVICGRLEAAAKADFVIALYNPKSGRRTRQIVEAQKIILKHRAPETPVGIVKSCKRDLEKIVVTNLADMLNHEIGMLTTILIGNTNTFRFHDLIVTPRGYTNKYDLTTEEVKKGQRPGISLNAALVEKPAATPLAPREAEKLPAPPSSGTPAVRAWGTLYGVGVGPGDPGLLVMRAVQAIGKVQHVFYPSSSGTDESLALNAIEPYLGKCVKFHQLFFPMTKDRSELEKHWNLAAEEVGGILAQGKDALFVTLGDPMIYSTYIYLLDTVKKHFPEATTETIPGISSFSAAASLIDTAISEGKERVALIPVNREVSNVEDALDDFDTVVLFKVGSKLPRLLELLEKKGLIDHAVLFSYLGTPDQVVEKDLRSVKREPIGYMSLMLVKKSKTFTLDDEEEHELAKVQTL
jgi:precorrin-3B C17-methyltransferase